MSDTAEAIAKDVAAVGRIDSVPSLLRVLCETTGMRFAAVARVTDHSWTACAVLDRIELGLTPGGQLPLDSTLCMESRAARMPIAISQASTDAVYSNHHTPRIYGIESYVSVPIVLPNGDYFGNLCAIDPAPAHVTEERIVSMFQLFAELIAVQLENDRKRESIQAALLDEREAGELREQFIAVLGHDLRNPLAAISACGQLLQHSLKDAAMNKVAARINTNVKRMSLLIDDVLDFARGRLGGGLGIQLQDAQHLDVALSSVVNELLDANPHRTVTSRIDMSGTVRCDPGRLQQLASNLLANALTHGSPHGVVTFTAVAKDDELLIQVWNDGDPIPADSLDRIFSPFWRSSTSSKREGLGLGLHICAQIAKAHRGSLQVSSSRTDGTTFTARLPIERPASAAPLMAVSCDEGPHPSAH